MRPNQTLTRIHATRTVLWACCACSIQISSSVAQESAPSGGDTAVTERTTEELADLANWVEIVKNPSVELSQRIFNSRKLTQNDWPEALQAALHLLDNNNGSCVCIPVCRAIAQNGSPRIEYADALITLLGDGDAGVRSEAAAALACYEDPSVIDRLRAIASDRASEPVRRVAAIDAISRLNETHLAAEILISLLDSAEAQVTAAVCRGLATVSGQDFGPDEVAWRGWWEANRDLKAEEWLKRQNALLKDQLRNKEGRIAKSEERLAGALSRAYSIAVKEERNSLLEQHLVDELEGVRLLAIDFIQRDIGDGILPTEAVAAILRSRITDPSARVRKGVLNVLVHLRAGTDARAVIELLSSEQDQSVRAAAIAALGHLANPEANAVLLAELQREDSSSACRVAAAKALGRLNARGNTEGADTAAIVAALLREYERNSQPSELQVALVQAMASIADPGFTPILLANLQHQQADVRLRCIAGLRQLDDKVHLEQVLPLLADADGGVRREAAGTIGQFGGTETHLAALTNRFRPEVEPEAAVRDAAWQSFVKVWSLQTSPAKMAWTRKLSDFPLRQIELLKSLETQFGSVDPSPPELLEVRTAMANQYDVLLRFGDAAKCWSSVAEMLERAQDPAWRAAATKQFRDTLLAGQYEVAVTQGKRILGEKGEESELAVKGAILEALTTEKAAKRDEAVAKLLEVVRAQFGELVTGEFQDRLLQYDNKHISTESGQQPSSTGERSKSPGTLWRGSRFDSATTGGANG